MKLVKVNDACICVAVDESLAIVFGSPPEWIKCAPDIPFPQYIFLGDTVLDEGYNFCEIEFPVYKNFFFNRQRKTHIVAPPERAKSLKSVLEEALLGPPSYPDDPNSHKAAFYADRLAVRENFSPSGRKLHVPDFAGFETYHGDRYRLGTLEVRRTGPDSFLAIRGREELRITLSRPPGVPAARKSGGTGRSSSLAIRCFDSGDGFSPGKGCSSFMVCAGEDILLFDPSVGSFDAFAEGGYGLENIKGIFLSHLHADHDQGLYRFLAADAAIPVFAGGVVHSSLLGKLEEIHGKGGGGSFSLRRLDVGADTALPDMDVRVRFEYGFHSIPSLMMKLYFRGKGFRHVLGYSGDTLYDPLRFRDDDFPGEYRKGLETFFDDADTIIHEAGAGLIHTDPEDLIPFLKESQRIFWLHTPRTNENGFSRGSILEKGQSIDLS